MGESFLVGIVVRRQSCSLKYITIRAEKQTEKAIRLQLGLHVDLPANKMF